ncbi:hypothetical protein BJ170DRAFT_734335 [Xylariales sp. AK1849]|nr:hypothetical protein BJ170DRAFT_734335 [Xylariales sp. AK1849]
MQTSLTALVGIFLIANTLAAPVANKEAEPFTGIKREEAEPFTGIKREEAEPFTGIKREEAEPFTGIKREEAEPFTVRSEKNVCLSNTNFHSNTRGLLPGPTSQTDEMDSYK